MSYINLPIGIRIPNASPLDGDRYIAADIDQRNQLVLDDRAYVGMQVFVESEAKLYILVKFGPSTWEEIPNNSYVVDIDGSINAIFSRLDIIDSSITTISNTLIEHDSSIVQSIVYDPSISPSLEVVTSIGGIIDGTQASELLGMTYEDIWTAALFPTKDAWISSNKNAVLSGISTTTKEVGESFVGSVTAAYYPGVITNGDGTIGPNLTGNSISFVFRLDGAETTLLSTTNNKAFTYGNKIITWGSNIWDVVVNYSQGTLPYYDNKGILGTNLDASRVSSLIVATAGIITGRRYTWYGSGAINSTPVNSVEVRALSDKLFLSSTNTGTFNIEILAGDPEVYFYIPTGKTVSVKYVQSSYADVTQDFVPGTAITVNDAANVGQSYEKYSTSIGLTGYLVDATYEVTIS